MSAPKGNNFARNGQVAKKALEHAMLAYQGEEPTGEKVSEFKALVDIWKAQIAKAVTDSDTQSANMIIDRMDGKAKQQTELSGKVEIEAYELSDVERSARIAALLEQARSRRDGQAADDGSEVDAS